MVIMVVYAHISTCGIGGGVHGNVENDNRIYNLTDPSTFGVRWISIVRQYCLPLLFFVSGAAAACSFKKKPGFGKIVVYTLLGIALNAALWFLGPRNPSCDPATGFDRPECRGAIFDFTICPFDGKIFPMIFQMWYTAMLLVFMLLNWPLFAYLHSKKNETTRCSIPSLMLQLLMTVLLEAALVVMGGSEIKNPVLVICLSAFSEGLFIALAILGKRYVDQLRLIHYALGVIATLQCSWLHHRLVGEGLFRICLMFVRATRGKQNESAWEFLEILSLSPSLSPYPLLFSSGNFSLLEPIRPKAL